MLKDLNAQEKDTITFEVTVNYEGVTYKWLKNGVEVKSSERCQLRSRQLTHSLTIRNVHFGDGGEYRFVAGSAATTANLFVEGNLDSKEEGGVLERQRATFEFEVNEDDVEGRWLRNGVEIQFSTEERFSYVTVRRLHRLTIIETYRSDAGEYTFIAGKNRSAVHLRVNRESHPLSGGGVKAVRTQWLPVGELPTEQPVEGHETRLQRDSEYFVSEEEALAQRILKWQQDAVEQDEVTELESDWTLDSHYKPPGSVIPSETDNKSMIISLDVLPSIYEEGTVDFVTQEHDDLKIAFEVTEMPPRFINPICDMETPEGTTVMFECSLMGIPSPIVSWFKSDKKIPHNNKKYLHSSDGDNHFLKIGRVTPQDSGVYTCRAINVVGETLCRASLVVLSTQAFSGKTRGRELTFEFEQEADESQRAVRLVANTDNELSEQGEKYVSINFDVFAEPAKDDKVEFKGKSSEMCSFQFQVTETPPKCIIPLTNVTAALGTPVILQCLVNGKPNPTAEWYKDGERVTDSRCIIQEKTAGHFNLLITNVTQSDAGEYKCVIHNSAGGVETSALLKVIDKPRFVRTVEPASAAVNDPVRLECQVDEDTGVTVSWTRDGKKVHQSMDCKMSLEDKVAILEIPKSKVKDSGTYMCTASNEAGSSSCEAVVSVQGKFFRWSVRALRSKLLHELVGFTLMMLTFCTALLSFVWLCFSCALFSCLPGDV
uniref:Ig-like domain-containing protein n=1 Tax=Salarias fasciatus TaxID=181472 RepID=A0A672I7U6_SALFA